MYVLKSRIEIGNYFFPNITQVDIVKDIDQLSDTASIQMPSQFKLLKGGQYVRAEQAIQVGDKVEIILGYEGKYEGVEFSGYVTSVGSKIPLEIKCENATWLLRRKNINKAFGKTTLKDILNEVVAGTEVSLAHNIPNMTVDKWIIKNANGAQVLQKLKETFSLSIYINDQGKLFAGLQQQNNIGEMVVYDINRNIVENNLEYRDASQKRVRVRVESTDKSGKVVRIELGDEDGELRQLKMHDVIKKEQMEKIAKETLMQMKYDGFEGTVKTFLIPWANRGMSAQIIDNEHPNRNGKYFIKKVEISFGNDGARRAVSISNRL